MEPPIFEASNLTVESEASVPLCESWRDGAEGPVFHLANMLLFLGFMASSGSYGVLYLFTLLTLGFFCCCLWAWTDPCSTQPLLWSLALFGVSLAQALYATYRLRSLSFHRDFQELYSHLFQRLGVSLSQYRRIVCSGDETVYSLEKGQCFAVEGKTPIDKLSVLLGGRVRVSVNGEFLHHIHPFQFLDSPEWDSLRPSEEGVFQVTLYADQPCRYVAWRRKKLYLLFAKHRYIARVFALLVRGDIADKLFSLSDKACDGSGHRFDLRLPTCSHRPRAELQHSPI